MTSDGTVDADAPVTLEELDLADRRAKVQSMRFRRVSIAQIAQQLGVSTDTVIRDLNVLREQWHRDYDSKPMMDARVLLGETMSLYSEVERNALIEFGKLGAQAGQDKPAAISLARMICLREARNARKAQISLLQDLNVIDRSLGTIEVSLPLAEDMRRQFKVVTKVSPDILIPAAERSLPPVQDRDFSEQIDE